MLAAEKPNPKIGIKIATVLLLVLINLPLGTWIGIGTGPADSLTREVIYWAMTAVVLAFVVGIERRPLSSIGLRALTWKGVGHGVAVGLVMTAVIAAIYLVIFPWMHVPLDLDKGTPIAALPRWLTVAIVCRAAVFEEVFYRGFAIERLAELTGSRYVAAIISLIAFTFAHLSGWGWSHLLVAAAGGAILTALYLARRDLLSNMIAHFVTDAIGFLL